MTELHKNAEVENSIPPNFFICQPFSIRSLYYFSLITPPQLIDRAITCSSPGTYLSLKKISRRKN